MKTIFTPFFMVIGLFSATIITNSCAKPDHSADLPKEQQVVGTWSINRIQLKLYSGSIFLKDTILLQTNHPNYVKFDANGSFEYKFNSTLPDEGTYQFAGADSVISNSLPQNYRWKMLTLTDKLFTVVNTGADPAFPGLKVERYQTFVR